MSRPDAHVRSDVLDTVLRLQRRLPLHSLDFFNYYRRDDELEARMRFRAETNVIDAVALAPITWPDLDAVASTRCEWFKIDTPTYTVVAGADVAGREGHAIGLWKVACVVLNVAILDSVDSDADAMWLTTLVVSTFDIEPNISLGTSWPGIPAPVGNAR